MTTTANPYLQGNFAPVLEEVTATDLAVTGHLPEALSAGTSATGRIPSRPRALHLPLVHR